MTPHSTTSESVRRFETAATRTLGIRYPIVQGGLARIARAELAGAVSAAGGLGQLAAAGLGTPELLRAEIRKVRRLTEAPFGVNFPVGHMPIDVLIDVVLEEKVAVVSFTGGNPKPYIRRMEGSGIGILVLVAGPEQAIRAEQAGADIIATVGFEGGGHIGRSDLTTMVAVPLVKRAVGIPVLAGGGIADGSGLAAALALGADGVEVGTRFIAVKEAYAHEGYKAAVVQTKSDDTVVIKRSLGTPGRALSNRWTERILAAEAQGKPRDEVLALVRADANERAVRDGDMETGLAWLGQSAAIASDIPGAGALVERMAAEARDILRGLAQTMT
ncbi:Nitronate monooxygenase [Achromobacter xylosoxidans]|uniref:NAD(P)H-dependent flavin oxidoreductase n=1 Tax=Alcaligenes xylosoxydans xylosoxydans TaxID=85698 RepID=UPI0006BF4F3E|nr:nitronate monooxygenase [Achromobacter xylosoxidans]CUJ31115.1 Nitronate monooxygenase [Achromobacter xylosoxidans]CUJ71199.1 Nitronate monooxygenase [Achromobacter xylosoxidans]